MRFQVVILQSAKNHLKDINAYIPRGFSAAT